VIAGAQSFSWLVLSVDMTWAFTLVLFPSSLVSIMSMIIKVKWKRPFYCISGGIRSSCGWKLCTDEVWFIIMVTAQNQIISLCCWIHDLVSRFDFNLHLFFTQPWFNLNNAFFSYLISLWNMEGTWFWMLLLYFGDTILVAERDNFVYMANKRLSTHQRVHGLF